MKKYNYIGITKKGFTLLQSLAEFSVLKHNIDSIEASDFIMVSQGWGGVTDNMDDIRLRYNLKTTSNELELPKVLDFYNTDHDCGRSSSNYVHVTGIIELVSKKYVCIYQDKENSNDKELLNSIYDKIWKYSDDQIDVILNKQEFKQYILSHTVEESLRKIGNMMYGSGLCTGLRLMKVNLHDILDIDIENKLIHWKDKNLNTDNG